MDEDVGRLIIKTKKLEVEAKNKKEEHEAKKLHATAVLLGKVLSPISSR